MKFQYLKSFSAFSSWDKPSVQSQDRTIFGFLRSQLALNKKESSQQWWGLKLIRRFLRSLQFSSTSRRNLGSLPPCYNCNVENVFEELGFVHVKHPFEMIDDDWEKITKYTRKCVLMGQKDPVKACVMGYVKWLKEVNSNMKKH